MLGIIKAVIIHKNGGLTYGAGISRNRQTGIRARAGTGLTLPALFRPDEATATRVIEFFTANIRNPNTRKAYAKAAVDLAAWCDRAACIISATCSPST